MMIPKKIGLVSCTNACLIGYVHSKIIPGYIEY